MADIFGSGNRKDKWVKKATEWINYLFNHKSDTLVAGQNITLTPDSTNHTVTVSSTASGGASSLADLTDTNIDNPADGQALVYDNGEWVNAPLPSAPVTDVQVDGVSVVTDGIAEIDLTDYAKSADLPTKVSDLQNDSGFIDNTVNNLTNYYLKTDTYTQAEVDALISSIITLNILVVQTLPTTDISRTTIYLVPKSTAQTSNVYDEYINTTGTSAGWEKIGDTEVDLSNYYTKSETDTLLSNKVDKVTGKGLSTNDYTTAEKNKLGTLTQNFRGIVTVEAADSFVAGWRRFAKITASGNYGSALLAFRGGWSNSAPYVGTVLYTIRNNEAKLRILDGFSQTNQVHQKLRAVRISANNYYLEMYRLATSTANSKQYCDIVPISGTKNWTVTETSDTPPINNNATGAYDYEISLMNEQFMPYQTNTGYIGTADKAWKEGNINDIVALTLNGVTIGNDPKFTDTTYPVASASTNGLMSAADKVNLDNLGTDMTEVESVIDTDTTALEGNPLNFTTRSAQYAQDCNIEMNPIQDLHGYGKPWVGGAGKNKLRMSISDVKSANSNGTWTGNVYVSNGITYTLITDSDGYCIGAKARGTATSDAYLAFLFNESSVPAGNYYYSGCPSGGSNSTYDLFGWDRDTSARAKQWNGTTNVVSDFGDGNSQIKVVSGGRYLLRFRMKANYDSSSADVIVYPMLRLSTETDKTWQPYENICPIYPYTGMRLEGFGKNLYIGSPSFDGYENRSKWTLANETYNGHEVIYKGYSGGSVYKNIQLKAGVTYTFSAMIKASASDTLYYIYKDSGVFLTVGHVGTTWKKIKATFTAETDFESRLRVENGSIDSTIYISEFQLELGSDATDYEPYQQSLIPISFGSIAPYGGTLDVRTGKLVVDRAIVDIGDLAWVYMSANAYFTVQIAGKAYNQNNICTCYSLDTSSVATMADGTFKGSINNNYVYVKDLRYTNANTFKTALAGQKIVYEITEPQTYYLSPHEVNLLLGVNDMRAWAINTTQSIKDTAYCLFKNLVYRNGVMASLADIQSAVEIADRQNAWKYFTTHHANAMTPLNVDSWKEYKFVAYIPYNDNLYYLTASIERNSILDILQDGIITVGFTVCDGIEMKMWINTAGGIDSMVITGESPNNDILIYYR